MKLDEAKQITAPVLAVVPRLDETTASTRPVLAWHNSTGGIGGMRYILQIDTTLEFTGADLMEWPDIPETQSITSFRPKAGCELKDQTYYYWRVAAIDSDGEKSQWGKEIGGITARFYVNSSAYQEFFGVRVPATEITATSGSGSEKIQDYDESGVTYWEGAADDEGHWVKFDLGYKTAISRIWLLCGLAGWYGQKNREYAYLNQDIDLTGRLTVYKWEYSNDEKHWTEVPHSRVIGSDAFRRDLIFPEPVCARYFRLNITKWIGLAPRIHEVSFYRKGQPEMPETLEREKDNYVLVIGTYCSEQMNQNTELRDALLGLKGHMALPWDLEVMEVPAYKMSWEVLSSMDPKPMAICLTGSSRWGEMLPRFEYNGVFEIIRNTDIPVLGVCNGHQLLALQEEITFVRNMGRSYYSDTVESLLHEDIPSVLIEKADPIFSGMTNPFFGPEYHSWSIDVMPEGFEVLATSKDHQGHKCIEVIKAKDRLIYGTQFHPEKPYPWNGSKMILVNFLYLSLILRDTQDDM